MDARGHIPSNLGHIKVLTMLEGMCGFAGAAPMAKEDSGSVAQATFASFFIPFGLSRLVVVDAGNPMHGVLVVMCKTLGVPHITVSRGNHRAIRNERFHRYMNKALKSQWRILSQQRRGGKLCYLQSTHGMPPRSTAQI